MSADAIPYWRISGFYFFYFSFVGAFAPYWALYLKSLGFDAFQIGVLMSLLPVTRIFAPNAWGWLADHTGRHAAVVQIAAWAGLCSYLGVFVGASFAWMFAVMVLMSFFWSGSLPLVEAMILGRLGSGTGHYGRIRMWGSIGFILAVIGVGYVLDLVPIGILLWVILGLMAGIALLSRNIPEAQVMPHEELPRAVWSILRQPEVLALFCACFLMCAAHGPYYNFYSLFLVAHDYSKGLVGWLWATGVIFEVGVFFWLPRLFRAFSLRRILIVSFALAVARFVLIGWGVRLPAAMVLAQSLHAASFGSYHAAAVALVHKYFRGRNQAKGQALYTSLTFGAGGTAGGLASGYSWDSLGPGLTFTLAAGCALVGMLLVIWKVRAEN